MAAGDVTQQARGYSLSILEGATATNSAPSGASAGVALSALDNFIGALTSIPQATVQVWSTAGSGTMTVTVKLWGYANSRWSPLGTSATASSKGLLNGGNAIGETGTDTIDHAEPVYQISDFDRVYAEITAIGGTATAIRVAIVVPRSIN